MGVSALLSEAEEAHSTEAQNTEAKLDDAALDLSIATVSSSVLRGLLRSFCESLPGAKEKAIEHLLVAKDKVPIVPDPDSEEESDGEFEEDKDEDEDEGTDKRITAPAKQPSGKRPRYAQCRRCKEEFDTSKNSRTSCVYHTGTLHGSCLLVRYLISF